jgi:RHS repeat-associated protein
LDGDGDPDDGDLGKTDSGLDERLYYCTDAGCNVTALVTAAGTVVERYAYDPYGQPIFHDGSWGSRSTSSYGNAILYAGYCYDAETGFYHVRNRMYHAQLGRWVTRDPLGYVDGMGLYEYCGTNPLLNSDPLGRSFWSIVGNFAAGVVVGAAIAAVVIVAAPVVAAAGAAALVATGVCTTLATATVAATTVVSGGLLVAAAAGVAATAVTTVNAVQAGDWDTVAYNAGAIVGGLAVGAAGGRTTANSLSPEPSQAPPLWKPIETWRYEWARGYNPNYINPDGTPGSLLGAFGKGPTPAGAAGAAGLAGAGDAAAAGNGGGGGGGGGGNGGGNGGGGGGSTEKVK